MNTRTFWEYMSKHGAQKVTNGRYFIAIPTSYGGPEHMTVKFLGELSETQVQKAKDRMEALANIEKVPLTSKGVGLLGRKSPYFVDFVDDEDRRIRDIFKTFNKSSKKTIPHVTAFKIKKTDTTFNTGAIDPMSSVLADKVVLYRTAGMHKYETVYEVALKNRTPWNWVKDRFANWL